MAYSSQLGMRGWISAISLAGVLTGVFWYSHQYSLVHGPEHYYALRSANQATDPAKAPTNIATDDIRDELLEPSFTHHPSTWREYRSRPATSAFALVEPTARVRLYAPRMDDVEREIALADPSRQNRADLSEPAAAPSIQTVSRARQPILDWDTSTPRSKPAAGQNHLNGEVWPQPTRLLEDLNKLKVLAGNNGNRSVIDWAQGVESLLDHFSSHSIQDPLSADWMDSLQRSAADVIQSPLTDYQADSPTQLQTRIAHSLIRRIAVWKAVWLCVAGPKKEWLVDARPQFEMACLSECIDEIQLAMQATGDALGWEKYLMMDELRRLASGNDIDVQLASQTAQVLLGRITSSNVAAVQREFLDSTSVRALADCLQPLAVAPVDYQALLADLERLEEDAEHRSRLSLITAMQSLRFADDPQQAAVSQAIDTYYRNANVRIAVAGSLLNRLLPADKTIQRPVRQTILGAETRGNSDVKTTLRVRLMPDPNAWNLQLDLKGRIESQTRSSRGPATFFNSSMADVATSRAIRITAQGIDIQGGPAEVQSQDALRSLETNFDGLPFVGDMVRYYAQQEFKEKRGPARRILQRSIATQTDTEFDKQLDTQLQLAEESFEKKLIGPLRNLNLNPMVSDLQTTDERLIARYRLASDNCLAANTPRPQAPADSLLSVQMHQSAMNNGFSQLGLSDRNWTLLELAQSLAQQFGQEPIANIPEEIPADVLIRFEGDRPVIVEFLDGRLWLTLRIATLTQPGRIELNDFVIRTSYLPAVTGLQAELVRDGAISVDGDRLSMRERLPLRAIFGKVFAARSTIPIISPEMLKDPRAEGLAISQLILEENWLAIAISEVDSPHVAILRSLQLQR